MSKFQFRVFLDFALWFFALSFTLPSLAQEKKQEQQVEQLLKQLDDDEWKVREEATDKLIELWEDDAVKKRVEETLEKAVKEDNAEVKDRCERILAGIALRRALGKELMKQLGAEKVEELLGKKKFEWVSVIGECLKEKPELLSAKQKEQLAEEILKDEDCRKYLKEMAHGRHGIQVEGVWFYLGALGHSDAEVRSIAAWALGGIVVLGEPGKKVVEEIVKALIGMLEDKDESVRRNAARMLGDIAIRGKVGKKVLEEVLSAVEGALKKEEDKGVRQEFRRILKQLKQRKQELEQKK